MMKRMNPYGPRPAGATAAYGIVNWFCELALAGQPLPVYGRGEQLRERLRIQHLDPELLDMLRRLLEGRTP